jgi:A/G-specific adenine glycosylase
MDSEKIFVPHSDIFSIKLLQWFDLFGRKDLPWQKNPTAYSVWVSEIMLQQTKVSTVIPYYVRFMKTFPDLEALAQASEDIVLHHWSGLGYYARASNLHKTAKIISSHHQGIFPNTLEGLESLPGIGRSTAGAICAIAYKKSVSILDGNVKRVLARHEAIDGWTGHSKILKLLWAAAENYTPTERIADYTQAIMDLGATLCTRSKPRCYECPVSDSCKGLIAGNPEYYPKKKTF